MALAENQSSLDPSGFQPERADEALCWQMLPMLEGPQLAETLSRLGLLRFDKSDHAQAATLAEQAAAIWREQGYDTMAARAHLNAGQSLSHMRRTEAALAQFLAAAELADLAGNLELQVQIDTRLALAYRTLGQLEAAARHFSKAADGGAAAGESPTEYISNLDLGDLLRSMGRPAEAAARYETAYGIAATDGKILAAARAMIRWADVLMAMGKFADAATRLELVVSLAEFRGEEQEHLTAWLKWAEALHGSGDPAAAATQARAVLELVDGGEASLKLRASAELLLAECEFELGRPAEALIEAELLETPLGLAADFAGVVRLFHLRARCQLELGEFDAALEMLERLKGIARDGMMPPGRLANQVYCLEALVKARQRLRGNKPVPRRVVEMLVEPMVDTELTGPLSDLWLLQSLELAWLEAMLRQREPDKWAAHSAKQMLARGTGDLSAYTGSRRAALRLLAARALPAGDASLPEVLLVALSEFVAAGDLAGAEDCRDWAARLMPAAFAAG